MRRGQGQPTPLAGTLSMVDVIAMTAGDNPRSIIVSPDGTGAYVTLFDQAKVAQYSRNVNTGKLTPLGTRDFATTNTNPAYMVFSADSTVLYVTHPGNDFFKPLARNTGTNVLTSIPGTSATTGGVQQHGVAISPDGLFLYLACRNGGTGMGRVAMLNKTSAGAACTLLSPAGIDVGTGAGSISVAMTRTDNGLNLYVGNFNNNTVSLFRRNTSTGQLTVNATQATISTGSTTSTCWLAIDHQDKHLYVVLDNLAQVACYSIDPTTGALTLVGTYATGNGPFSIAMTSDSVHVFIGDSDGQTIHQYTRDTTTGALTPKSPALVRSDAYMTTVTGSNGPQVLFVAPGDKHLYATNSTSPGSITQFNIHA